MGDFLMPSLGADMEHGTVAEWKVQPGDVVHRGDVIAVIETDKSDIDAEVFEDGQIQELLVAVGEQVPVGTPLARILGGSGAPVPVPIEQAAPPPPAHEVLSPVVRHLAEDAGVDIDAIEGSGPGGRIMRTDIEHATPPPTPAPPPAPTPPPGPRPAREHLSPRARRLAARATPPTGEAPVSAAADDRSLKMQRRIAQTMERSNREIPHYYVSRDCDFSNAQHWLTAHNAELPPNQRVLPAALFLWAIARAAAEVPGFNGFWTEGAFHPATSVDVGFIVSLRDGGLLAPVIPSAHLMTIDEVMATMRELVTRARSGHLRSSDLAEPTISASILGDQGGDEVLGVIYPPQVALVGVGRPSERPWAVDGLLGVHPVVTISVAGDHRASDGHRASRFIGAIDRHLQEPNQSKDPSHGHDQPA